MQRVTIELSDVLYDELQTAVASIRQPGYGRGQLRAGNCGKASWHHGAFGPSRPPHTGPVSARSLRGLKSRKGMPSRGRKRSRYEEGRQIGRIHCRVG